MGEILFSKSNLREPDSEGKECDTANVEDAGNGSSSKTYLCSTCGKAFRSKDTLLRHKMSHTGAKPFSCDICKKGLSSAVSLKEHKAKHSEQKLYECSICGRGFRQNSSYRRHLITHSKASPHECCVCKRRFAQRAYLRSHMRKHTGERPYLCDPPCCKSFAHLSDLKRHRVLHTGKRPYNCDICGSSFADRSSRRRHQKDHENKPWNYACKVCKSSFKKATQLEKHMSKAHGVSAPCQKDNANAKNSTNHIPPLAEVCENDLNANAVQVVPNRNSSLMEQSLSDAGKSHETILSNAPEGFLATRESHPHFQTVSDMSSVQIANSGSSNKVNNCCLPEMSPTDRDESVKNVRQDTFGTTLPVCFQKNHLQSADYVMHPDFNSQEYYEWLANFVSICKLLPYPVESEVFGRVNQVHKSIVDCLTSPSELIHNRTSFKALMGLSQDLLRIINGQLNFILNQLPE